MILIWCVDERWFLNRGVFGTTDQLLVKPEHTTRPVVANRKVPKVPGLIISSRFTVGKCLHGRIGRGGDTPYNGDHICGKFGMRI